VVPSDELDTERTTMDSIKINDLAMEQAILASENEIPMDAETAVDLNSANLRSPRERIRFKHDFRRHMRNIMEGNPFYD
jgi:hypothetical protein